LTSKNGYPRKASHLLQIKILITNNLFCIEQRATAQSKTGNFRDYGEAEAAPGFQAGWSDCIHYAFLSYVHFICSSGITM
jgi:hypothetical protein